MKRTDRDRAASEAADFVKEQFSARPRFALILGTGSNQLADAVSSETVIDYGEIPHFPCSTALGHRGRLVCGQLANQPIVVMQGRFHLYEGYSRERVALPIDMLAQIGTEFLFVSNAAGGLNPAMATGDVMLIESHIDLMFRAAGTIDPGPTARTDRRTVPYDPLLLAAGLACGRRHDFAVHRGVYAAMLGPTYETRAEYRMLRRIGADVAGMSTVPEVNAAARHGMRVLGLSLVTNVASPDAPQATSGEEVIEAARAGAPKLEAIVLDAIHRNS